MGARDAGDPVAAACGHAPHRFLNPGAACP
jgi:hypothetical protein